jgi:hypothetical protein
MTKRTTLFALTALAFSATALIYAEDRMRAGLWEVTTTVNGKSSGVRGNTCYTPAMVEMANSPAKTLRESTEKSLISRNCILKEFKMEGNSISMSSVCGARSSVTSSTYTVDGFETASTSTTAGVSTVTHMKGRRMGDCK